MVGPDLKSELITLDTPAVESLHYSEQQVTSEGPTSTSANDSIAGANSLSTTDTPLVMNAPAGNSGLPADSNEVGVSDPVVTPPANEQPTPSDPTLLQADAAEDKLVGTATETAPLTVGNVIKMRGLPWETTEADVVRFLAPSKVVTEKDIYLVMGPKGLCSGEAYVELASPEEQDKVIAELDGRNIGRRWIEIFKSTKSEMEKGSRESADRLMAGRAAGVALGSAAATGGVVRLRGLPWGATENDIIQFFSGGGFSIGGHQIAMPLVRGRASGEAYIDFGSAARAEEAKRIMNRRCIGSRYIEIFFANPRDFSDALKAMETGAVGPLRATSITPMVGGIMPGATLAPRRYDLEGPYGAAAPAPMMPSMYQPYPGTAVPPPAPMSAYQRDPAIAGVQAWGSAATLTAPPMPPTVASAAPTAAAAAAAIVANGGMPAMGYETDYRYGQATSPPPVMDGGFTVLRMRGLPFNATANNIVAFFDGYSMSTILPSTVPIDGRPSGEAYVEFRSSIEATRALRTRQKARMEHRYIELFPSTKEEMEMAANGWDSREIRARMGRGAGPVPPAV